MPIIDNANDDGNFMFSTSHKGKVTGSCLTVKPYKNKFQKWVI